MCLGAHEMLLSQCSVCVHGMLHITLYLLSKASFFTDPACWIYTGTSLIKTPLYMSQCTSVCSCHGVVYIFYL